MSSRGLGRLGIMEPGLEATERPTVHDIIWAAGIYEGEGSCKARSNVRVTQKDPWILKKLQRLFGGRVSLSGGAYRWSICGPRARGFAMTIYKFLSPGRQEQIVKSLKQKGEQDAFCC